MSGGSFRFEMQAANKFGGINDVQIAKRLFGIMFADVHGSKPLVYLYGVALPFLLGTHLKPVSRFYANSLKI